MVLANSQSRRYFVARFKSSLSQCHGKLTMPHSQVRTSKLPRDRTQYLRALRLTGSRPLAQTGCRASRLFG